MENSVFSWEFFKVCFNIKKQEKYCVKLPHCQPANLGHKQSILLPTDGGRGSISGLLGPVDFSRIRLVTDQI